MRKFKLFFACLLMAVLSIGQMWAEETLLFSQTYPGSPSGYPNSYTGSYTLTTGDYTLTYANINNGTKAADNWTAVRAGRKKNASVASVTTGQIATAVSKVTITFTQVNADLTNDLYLEVADNANFTSATKISQTIALSEVAFTIASPAANQYYRIMIDQKSGSNNGFTRFSGVAFYYNEGGGDDPVTPTPSLSVSPTEIDFGSVELGASVPSEALTVTFANLTGDVTYSTLGGPFSASGTIEASGDQITISAEAAEAGQYSETFTVQSNEDNLSKTVTVKMNVFEPFYGLELTFPAYNDESIGSYSSTWTATKSEQVWTIANFNNNKNGWNLIKAGSKNNTSVASITTYVENPVESIVVTVSSVTADLVNSHKLYVADNSSFDNAIEIDGNPATIAAGDITYVIPEADRANNLYYKLEYDLKQGSANGFLQITKLTYAYGTAAPQKPAAGLAYAEADKKQLVKFGETFTAPTLSNPNNLTNITYASNNTEVAEVDVNGAVTIKAIGVAVIAVSFAGDDNYKAGSDTYTICVVNHLGTEADPFDVADARRVIDAFGTKEGVYMSGIVSQITTPYDETYHNISFDISTDGTPTADQVRAYRCKGLDNTDFTSEDDVKTGATVTVYGNLKKYNSTYEFDAGCYLKAYEAPAVPKTPIANTKETAYTVAQALVYAADGATYDLDDYVYISGVVYDVQNFNNGKLSIFIKDADAENQFELYNCAGINDGSATTPFESINDVKVGNVVIGYGQMMYYQQGDIYEFKAGNYLAELQKPVTGVWISELEAQVEVDAQYTLTAYVWPIDADNQTIDWTVESGDAYASVADGVVTGIAEGVATIRATAHGTEFYKECTVTVTASSTPVLTDYYEKVTSTADIVEGTYLIVYEGESVAFDGGLDDSDNDHKLDKASNTIAVDITTDHKIGVTSATEAATFYIDPTAGTIQSASGKYIGVTSNSNGLKTSDNASAYNNSFAIDGDGNAIIGAVFSESTMTLRYNTDSGQKRFRYYKTTGSPAGQLYKLANEVTKLNPELAWDKESIELTVGGLFISPELSHAQGITGTISYVSDNENVATVENGVISLVAEATGTAHITASYAGDENYKPGSAVCTIKVNPAHSIYVDKLNVNFGSVAKDATVDAIAVAVTLTNVDAATATLSGSGASAYSIDPAALTASGTITISASTATVGTFNAKLTISDDANEAEAKEVNLKLIVTDPASEETPISTSTEWVAATEITDGMQVLITGVKDEVVYAMGEQKSTNRAAYIATVDGEGVLTPGEGTMAFTLVAQGDGTYAIRTSNGKYLYAAKNDANHLKTQDDVDVNAKWTMTVASAVAEGSSNRNVMQFNGGSSKLFSCYASASQQAIALYVPKPVTPPTPTYETVRENLVANRYYTLCFYRTMTAVQGATFWAFASKDANMAYLVQQDAPYAAGTPYIIYAEAAGDLTAVLSGDVETNPGVNGALHGTFDLMDQTALDNAGENIYLLMNNQLRRVDGQLGNSLPAYRAYIDLDEIDNSGAPANVPAHRVRAIPMHKDVVTGFENVNATDKPVKLLIDGNIYILRGEKMYDATGRLVK